LENRRVREHYLFFLVRERGVLEFGGRTHMLDPGSLCWLPPRAIHSLRPVDPSRPFTFYHLRFELLDGGVPLVFREEGVVLPRASALELDLAILYDELRLRVPHSDLRFRSLLTALLIESLRLERRGRERGPVLAPPQRRLLMDHMEEVLPGPLDARSWARVVGFTPDYFTRLFRRTYGQSPRSFIMEERMRRAAELLTGTAATVGEVARSCGYEDLFVFSRLFKKVYGRSPRGYRNAEGSSG
jgi:AraC-like DNA-binding protein